MRTAAKQGMTSFRTALLLRKITRPHDLWATNLRERFDAQKGVRLKRGLVNLARERSSFICSRGGRVCLAGEPERTNGFKGKQVPTSFHGFQWGGR